MSNPFSALWHLRGSVAIDPALCDAAVMERLEEMLRGQAKPPMRPEPSVVTFTRSLLAPTGRFGSNWLAMAVYDRGRFWIEQGLDGRRVHYDLRSLEAFIGCLVFAGFVLFMQGLNGDLAAGVGIGLFFFAFLYGVNMLLAWVRIPGKIQRCARHRDASLVG